MSVRFGGMVELEVLKGKTFDRVYVTEDELDGNDCIVFYSEKGQSYALGHRQDCCESVRVEDIDNNLDVLEGLPINLVYESYSSNTSDYNSETWSFYRFGTAKGYLAVRFYGESNGYYSESAELYEV